MRPAGRPLESQEGVAVEEFLEHPRVLLDLPLSSDYFMSFFDAAGRRPKIVERTRDMAVMRSLVANGFGFGIANIRPHSDVSPDGRQLRFVPLKGDQRPMNLGLILPEGARAVLTVSAFLSLTEEIITKWGYPGRAL